jgi:hypothetical protein
MNERGSYVVRAELTLESQADPAAVGAAVTVALCGHTVTADVLSPEERELADHLARVTPGGAADQR